MLRTKIFKRRRQRKWFFPVFIPVLLFIFFCLVIGNFKISQKRKGLNPEIDALKDEMEQLRQEREMLRSNISQSQFPEYLEEVAREDLNLRKEEEKVVAFPIVQEPPEEEAVEEKSFWQKVFDL